MQLRCGKVFYHGTVAQHYRLPLFDLSPFSKFDISGVDAETLQRLCSNRVDQPIGKIVYTLMLNERGGIEAEGTVTRIDEARWRLMQAAALYQQEHVDHQADQPTQAAGGQSTEQATWLAACAGIVGLPSRPNAGTLGPAGILRDIICAGRDSSAPRAGVLRRYRIVGGRLHGEHYRQQRSEQIADGSAVGSGPTYPFILPLHRVVGTQRAGRWLWQNVAGSG